jgi:SAM-dependent methyltransferase
LPVKTVLDVGCGTGAILARLARLSFGEAYYALDVAETAVALVRQRPDIPNLVEARNFDGRCIPYERHQFDLAILSHVVEHLPDPAPLIREAARVARYAVIEVPLEDNLHIHLKTNLFKSRYREEIGHVQWFNQDRFRALLAKDCRLQVMALKVVYVPDELYFFRKPGARKIPTFLLLQFRKLVRTLSDRLYTRLMTDHCIALVRSADEDSSRSQ